MRWGSERKIEVQREREGDREIKRATERYRENDRVGKM